MLYQLGYVSTATRPLGAAELAEILRVARERNGQRALTGLLLYKQGAFMQVLEGERDAVREVYGRIEADPRHRELEVLFEGPLERREFADWSMAFVDLDSVDAGTMAGFSDFLESDDAPRRYLQSLTEAKRFLLLFRAMQ